MPKKKFRQPTIQVERELSSEEIDKLDGEMLSYVNGLKERAAEIKTNLNNILIEDSLRHDLEVELADTEAQINKIEKFDQDLVIRNFDSVTTKPID